MPDRQPVPSLDEGQPRAGSFVLTKQHVEGACRRPVRSDSGASFVKATGRSFHPCSCSWPDARSVLPGCGTWSDGSPTGTKRRISDTAVSGAGVGTASASPPVLLCQASRAGSGPFAERIPDLRLQYGRCLPLRKVRGAVAGLTLRRSSGPVQGHVNRMKMIKRQYRRSSLFPGCGSCVPGHRRQCGTRPGRYRSWTTHGTRRRAQRRG